MFVGTPATQSQLAKDVATFLAWNCDRTKADRSMAGMQVSLTHSHLQNALV